MLKNKWTVDRIESQFVRSRVRFEFDIDGMMGPVESSIKIDPHPSLVGLLPNYLSVYGWHFAKIKFRKR